MNISILQIKKKKKLRKNVQRKIVLKKNAEKKIVNVKTRKKTNNIGNSLSINKYVICENL